eukprot:EG_transcript_17825
MCTGCRSLRDTQADFAHNPWLCNECCHYGVEEPGASDSNGPSDPTSRLAAYILDSQAVVADSSAASPLPSHDSDGFEDTPALMGCVRVLPLVNKGATSVMKLGLDRLQNAAQPVGNGGDLGHFSDSSKEEELSPKESEFAPPSLGSLRQRMAASQQESRMERHNSNLPRSNSLNDDNRITMREMLRLRLEAKSAEVTRLKDRCSDYSEKCDTMEADIQQLKAAMWFAMVVCLVLIGTYIGEV